MDKKILFSSGGTGGHVFPTIAVMKHFFSQGYKVLLVTDKRASKYLDENNTIQSYILNTDTLTKKNFFLSILASMKIIFSVIRSILVLKKEKPNLVFGLGGYVSFPICLASAILKVPLILYENNLVLGKTNKYLLPFAQKLLTSTNSIINYSGKYSNKTHRVGNILREEILKFSLHQQENTNSTFTILILGGSQGATIFGQIIPDVIKKIQDNGYKIKIYQQCIKDQKNKLVDFYNKHSIENFVFNFTNNILDLISQADLAISRSGASTVAELEYTQTPFIAVPYPFAIDDHQYLNAKFYKEKDCCWIIEQKDFSSENLFNLIKKILQDKNKLKIVQQNMKKNDTKFTFSKIEKIVREII